MEDIGVNKLSTTAVISPLPDTKYPPAKVKLLSKAFLLKLFTGRLNFSGYILGMLAITIIASILSTIGIISAVMNNGRPVVVIAAFIVLSIHLFFSASLTVRRLHDLNLPGYMALFLLPLYLVSYVTIFASMIGDNWLFAQILGISMLGMYAIYSYISQGFDLYVTFWPGTKVDNKYGKPSYHWSMKEVFCLREPALPGEYKPKGMSKFVKILLKMLIWLTIFTVAFFAIAFGLIFIKDLFGF